MHDQYTAVIPFYNEGNRLIYTLNQLLKVPSLSYIIAVDDGSKDNMYQTIKKDYSQVNVLRSIKNQGKSKAVAWGLTKVKTPYVYLCDADLVDIQPGEIEKTLNHVSKTKNVDMVITARSHGPLTSQIVRSHILFSGERLVKTDILREALKKNPEKYQLEAVLNEYCLKNQRVVYWVPGRARNTFKIQKFGLITGIIKEVQMMESILKKIGIPAYMKQVSLFARINLYTHQA